MNGALHKQINRIKQMYLGRKREGAMVCQILLPPGGKQESSEFPLALKIGPGTHVSKNSKCLFWNLLLSLYFW